MKFITTALTLFFLAALLSGCSTDDEKNDFLGDASAVDGGTATDGYAYNEDGTRVTEFNQNKVDELMSSPEFSDPASPLSKRTIYFEYDSSQVLNEFFPVIEAHAQYLMAHPSQHIVLEGHSDERGTREYNISLAEQRGKAVFKMLQLIGVMNNQVDIVSYGEEKPVAMGHDNDSFALNRRVEIVYK